MKFTLTMNVGDNAIRTAFDLQSALIGLAQRIGNHYGDQDLRVIQWGPLAGLDGKASDVTAVTGPNEGTDRTSPAYLALKELVRCVRGGDETSGCSMDDALLDADEVLEA